jgi:hypothetical protein
MRQRSGNESAARRTGVTLIVEVGLAAVSTGSILTISVTSFVSVVGLEGGAGNGGERL